MAGRVTGEVALVTGGSSGNCGSDMGDCCLLSGDHDEEPIGEFTLTNVEVSIDIGEHQSVTRERNSCGIGKS